MQPNQPGRQRGFTIVELLVAVLIGFLSIFAVYAVYSQNEKVDRSVGAVGNLQLTGLQTMYMLEQAIADAGSGMMYDETYKALFNCPAIKPNLPPQTGDQVSLRPVPVQIQQGVGGSSYDGLVLFSGATTSTYGVLRDLQPGYLQAGNNAIGPEGLPLPLLTRDVLVGIDTGSRICQVFEVKESDTTTRKATIVGNSSLANTFKPDVMINLGKAEQYRFWIDTTNNNTLRLDTFSLDDNSTWTSVSEGLLSNVVAFVAWYGLDTNDDNKIDQWSTATGEWAEDKVSGTDPAPLDEKHIKQIKAIRVGLIAAYDEPTKDDDSSGLQAAAEATKMTLFADCSGTCPTIPEFDLEQYTPPPGTKYRFRKYETIVPLRNSVWNANNAFIDN